MVEYLSEKAAKYAAGKKDKILQALITKVYAEGYWDGYNDHKNDVEMKSQNSSINYVDLGLPSKTLWADKFVESGGLIKYIPYCDAEMLSLPTVEQWKELMDKCKWVFENKKSFCIGPNGNFITFINTGYKKISDYSNIFYGVSFYFWLIKNDSENSAWGHFVNFDNKIDLGIKNKFLGYKLPIRLVKSDNA